MESDGALEMYQRSIQMYNVPYNSLIGDGNSSTCATVDKSRPDSPVVFIKMCQPCNEANR